MSLYKRVMHFKKWSSFFGPFWQTVCYMCIGAQRNILGLGLLKALIRPWQYVQQHEAVREMTGWAAAAGREAYTASVHHGPQLSCYNVLHRRRSQPLSYTQCPDQHPVMSNIIAYILTENAVTVSQNAEWCLSLSLDNLDVLLPY